MGERIVEIIVFLVNELKTTKGLVDIDVASLTRDGYTQSEISAAFSWLFEQMLSDRENLIKEESNDLSIRQLNEAERMVIQPEAYGYLLQCHQLGLLSNNDIEAIIEQTMTVGFLTVGINEVKTLVAALLFDGGAQDSQFSLGQNDTIH
ncbi:MAG TPA: DUF494 family protein [Bacteroidota bacterium]|nr:DUF494 family protein [Bacteroidota bacterium]